jgi:hypothetical protein
MSLLTFGLLQLFISDRGVLMSLDIMVSSNSPCSSTSFCVIYLILLCYVHMLKAYIFLEN